MTAFHTIAVSHEEILAGCRSRATDSELLSIAQEQGRVFVTRDRDFGGLVFSGANPLRPLGKCILSIAEGFRA